jgi:hypothetical protein
MYLVKTDSEGDEEWSYFIEHESRGDTDSGSFWIQTNDGGYIATGETGEYNLALIDLLLIKLEGGNQAPSAPDINGPANGSAKTSYKYGFVSIDPDGDEIFYYIDWGDGTSEDWIGPFTSEEKIGVNHSWAKKRTYVIRARVKDEYNAIGKWSTYEIVIPKNKPFNFNFPLLNWLVKRFLQVFPLLRQQIRV